MGVKVNFDDVVEPRVMDADSECELRIIDVTYANDKNGHPYLMPRFEVVGEVGAKDFTKFFGLPHSDMDAKKANNAKWSLLNFYKAIGVDPDAEIEPEELIGMTCVAILGVSTDEQWGEQNYIKRFVTEA